ncbi:MAG TPA: hypothetical protein VJ821_02875 [Anaerolineales bacterium]|nr:hypothetical protein [Anaerolineales bacterium]
MTLKKIATLCLVAALVQAIAAPMFGLNAAASDPTGSARYQGSIPYAEAPVATPTSGASTNSNPSGGGNGGG